MACRDCKFYDVDKVKDKAGRVLSKYTALCQWVSTEVYPTSVRLPWGEQRPTPSYMSPNDGVGCPCFIPREK